MDCPYKPVCGGPRGSHDGCKGKELNDNESALRLPEHNTSTGDRTEMTEDDCWWMAMGGREGREVGDRVTARLLYPPQRQMFASVQASIHSIDFHSR